VLVRPFKQAIYASEVAFRTDFGNEFIPFVLP